MPFIIYPAYSFELIYGLVLIAGTIGLFISGIVRRYPVSQWVAIVASVVIFFIIGVKLSAYNVEEWKEIVYSNSMEARKIKFIPTGILLVALFIPLIKRLLNFRPSVYDGFVFFLPLFEGVQRVGCFMSGCCHGTPTELPWAVHYAYPAALFFDHLDKGLTSYGQLYSQGVHPTQLYLLIGSILISIVLIITRKRFTVNGGITLFAVILLASFRFFIEFIKEPAPGTWSAYRWWHLNMLQWGLLVTIIVASAWLLVKIRLKSNTGKPMNPAADYPLRSALVLIFLALVAYLAGEILERIEAIVMNSVLLVSMAVVAIVAFRHYTAPALRYATLALILGGFTAMGFSLMEPDSTGQTPKNTGWWSIGLVGAAGSYEEVTTNCSGDVVNRTRRDYLQGGFSVNYHLMPKPNHHFALGVRNFYLTDQARNLDYSDYQRLYISPYYVTIPAMPAFRWESTMKTKPSTPQGMIKTGCLKPQEI